MNIENGMKKTILAALVFIYMSTALASNEEVSKKCKLVEATFECSLLYSIAENTEEQSRFFEIGFEAGINIFPLNEINSMPFGSCPSSFLGYSLYDGLPPSDIASYEFIMGGYYQFLRQQKIKSIGEKLGSGESSRVDLAKQEINQNNCSLVGE